MKQRTLRKVRTDKGWSQERLAEETKRVDPDGIGVDQTHISKIERGEISDPKNSTATLLEQALGVQRGTLTFGTNQAVA